MVMLRHSNLSYPLTTLATFSVFLCSGKDVLGQTTCVFSPDLFTDAFLVPTFYYCKSFTCSAVPLPYVTSTGFSTARVCLLFPKPEPVNAVAGVRDKEMNRDMKRNKGREELQ